MDSGTDEPMEAEDAFAQRQREAAVVAHKDGRSAFWTGARSRGLARPLNYHWWHCGRALFTGMAYPFEALVAIVEALQCTQSALRHKPACRGLPGGRGALHRGHPRIP